MLCQNVAHCKELPELLVHGHPACELPQLLRSPTNSTNGSPKAGSPRKDPGSPKSPRRNSKAWLAPPPHTPLSNLQPIKKEESYQEYESEGGWLNRQQFRMRGIIKSSRFQFCIGVLIAMNTLVMGLELDQHDSAAPSEVMLTFLSVRGLPQSFFDGFEIFFFMLFSMEFAARVFVFRCQLLREVSTYVDLLALSPVVLLFGFNLQSSRQLTLLRIARLVKLCRLLRIFRLCKELNMLVQSIASAMRALVWIGLLLLITVYCTAVGCTMIVGHNESFAADDARMLAYEEKYGKQVDTQRYWGSMMRSMLTLFQIFTLDGWNAVVRPVVETHQPWMLIVFLGFIFVTTFGLLNLLMGTIVDQAMQIARQHEEERDRLVQNEQKQMLLACVRLFSIMDVDGDGVVSAQEIANFLNDPSLQRELDQEMAHFKIKLDYANLMDICQRIAVEWFDDSAPDTDGITIEEFSGAAARLQGVAKSQDMLTVLITAKSSLEKVQACEAGLANLREIVQNQDAKLDCIIHMLDQSPRMPSFEELPSTQTESVACSSAGRLKYVSAPPKLFEGHISDHSSPEIPTQPWMPRSSERHCSGGERQISGGERITDASSDPETTHVHHTLREERNILRRTGSRSIATLLRDFDGFDDFLKTKTATAMKGYSARKSCSPKFSSDAKAERQVSCPDGLAQRESPPSPPQIPPIRRSTTEGDIGALGEASRRRSIGNSFPKLRGLRLSSRRSERLPSDSMSVLPSVVPDP